MTYIRGIKSTKSLETIIKEVNDLQPNDAANSKENSDETTSTENARSILKAHDSKKRDNIIPMQTLKAIRRILRDRDESSTDAPPLLQRLDHALSQSQLVFRSLAPSPSERDPDAATKYRARLEMLKMKAEEQKYTVLMKNLDTTQEQDVNVKSMTYATSVGLNMIVAPISFGSFMYYFSGHIFGWGIDADHLRPGQVDNRKVITGVVSGVAMLFIEMVLFVIRSHEFDASLRKKAKDTPNPFGYSKARMRKHFNGI